MLLTMLIVSTPKTELQLFSGSVWSSDAGAAHSSLALYL